MNSCVSFVQEEEVAVPAVENNLGYLKVVRRVVNAAFYQSADRSWRITDQRHCTSLQSLALYCRHSPSLLGSLSTSQLSE